MTIKRLELSKKRSMKNAGSREYTRNVISAPGISGYTIQSITVIIITIRDARICGNLGTRDRQ